MTRLEEKIRRLIHSDGPISVAEYMATCLYDPDHGYYSTREPFGRSGDFVTAPEISQLFGELVAIWLYCAGKEQGIQGPVLLVEIGPGRGTLMADMVRTLSQIDPSFCERVRIVLIETSERLRKVQKMTLDAAFVRLPGPMEPCWLESLADVPQGPVLLVANELFDAIPLRQYVKCDAGWRERCVTISQSDSLEFTVGPGTPDPRLLPSSACAARPGSILELAPQRHALMDMIAERIKTGGGAGLIFDYGYFGDPLGDTFQAIRQKEHAPVLEEPGLADLTTHVDFGALERAAHGQGVACAVCTQGDFLAGMGIHERARQLAKGKGGATGDEIASALSRLTDPDKMGHLFKALAISRSAVPLVPFLSRH